MSRISSIQTNFTAGEISPRLFGRVDLNKYQNGVKRSRNMSVKPQGGMFRRPGTVHVREVKDNSKYTLLVEFEFSDLESYVLEFGNNYIRFIKDDIHIESSPGVPYEIASPYTEAMLPYLQFAQSADVMYITHPALRTKELQRLSETSWQIVNYQNIDGPYLPENTSDISLRIFNTQDRAIITSSNPDFSAGDVGNWVEYRRNGIPMIAQVVTYIDDYNVEVEPVENIIGPVDPTAVLSEAAGTITSTVAIFSNNNVGSYIRLMDGSWFPILLYTDTTHVDVDTVLTMVTTTGRITMSDRVITVDIFSSSPIFEASDEGRMFRMNFSGEQVWGTILYVDTDHVIILADRPIPSKPTNPAELIDDGITTKWRLGAWSERTGYPSSVAFHEERLWFGATPSQPHTMWGSKSGDYNSHSPTETDSTVTDESALNYTISSGKVNAIKWMSSGPTLIFGTFGGEWQIRASSSTSEPITPTNISVVQHTTYGSGNIRPMRIGSSVLFVQRSRKKVREIYYDYESDSLVAKDITIVSEHILRQGGGARAIAYQQEPNNIYWAVLNNGQLAGLTYVKDQDVYAWHLHNIGGNGIVESIASIPQNNNRDDVVYLIVRRTINGQTKRYIERISDEVDPQTETDNLDLCYVDSAKRYSGVAISTMVGLDHLEGAEVQVFADGSYRGTRTVASGQVSVGTASSRIVVGFGASCCVHTLNPEGGNPQGSAQGKIRRVDHLAINVYKSMAFRFGPNLNNLEERSFRRASDVNTAPIPIKTEVVTVAMGDSYRYDGGVVIELEKPYPLNILSIVTDLSTST